MAVVVATAETAEVMADATNIKRRQGFIAYIKKMDTQSTSGLYKKAPLVLIPVFLVALFYGLYIHNQNTSRVSQDSTASYDIKPTALNGLSYDGLIKNSASFAQADQYAKARQFDKAREYMELAKKETTDPAAQGIISFRLAVLKESEGEYMEAIDLLKEILTQADLYTRLTRSYAFLEMGSIYYRFADERITDRIFEGDVYFKALRDAKDTELTYRHLFEESVNLYPVVLSELRIADWYVDQIYSAKVKKRTALTSKEQLEYEEIIKSRLDDADTDFERIKNLPNEYSAYGAQSLARRAVIIGRLTLSGVTWSGSFDDAFKAALAASASRPGYDGYVRYNYATILALADKAKNVERVRDILAPLYSDPEQYKNSPVLKFFKNERENILDSKSDLALLASIDPEFKKLLSSKGWRSSDFIVP